MIDIRRFDELGRADHGWLNANFHFSFSGYHNPARMHWGNIRVWNDDTIAPKSGFPPHSHSDMEIVTYVRTGAVTHKDNLGNEGRTVAGDVQVMSAGTGITHSEYNLEEEPTTLFQIWILPDRDRLGEPPRWGAKPFPKAERAGQWAVLASGIEGDAEALRINADARVLGASIAAGESLELALGKGRKAYLVPATGKLEIEGQPVKARDGVAVAEVEVLSIKALEDSEVVLVETA